MPYQKQPQRHLRVQILRRGEVIAEATADKYRKDLAAEGKGHGDHGFLLTVSPPLAAADWA